MKKRTKIVLVIIVGVLSLLVIGAFVNIGEQVFLASMDISSKESSAEGRNQYLKSINFDIDTFYSEYDIEEIVLDSSYHDHTITAEYIILDETKDRDTVVLVHGMGEDRKGTYPYAKIFLDKGFNVLMYDQRSSGGNNAMYST
ncbi:MAG: alpha/beta hydrolase, partial [Vallitaleaceae bacterium]|nr:alpha/beta hydrolase [Vallitaleaceae bacterium]